MLTKEQADEIEKQIIKELEEADDKEKYLSDLIEEVYGDTEDIDK